MKAQPLAVRFSRLVDKTESCWNWLGAIQANGYGVIGEGGRGSRTLRAHRVSYQLAHGVVIPENVHVCHTCDNRRCVRPDHLFLGTRRDNMQDAKAKGRLAPPPLHSGERQHLSRLNAESVRDIRRASARGTTNRALRERYQVCKRTIQDVLSRRTWGHVCD